MKPERWKQVDELFLAALEREPGERAAFLDDACTGDESLRGEVESMLASHERADSFLERPAVEMVAEVLADNSELAAGQRLGRYEIVAPLGEGGMGQIYLAEDTRLRRRVALKLLPSAFTGDRGWVGRFEQEARAASMLNHPNVCIIHEVGEAEDGRHFIAMEHVEGHTLRTRLGEGPLPLGDALGIAVQVASALATAHEAGVVHRDIKPENIMLRPDGIVKVLDFGLAKLADRRAPSAGTDAKMPSRVDTSPGVVLGTAAYVSPEQLRGQSVDARSDVFSLGVVLYEMIAGRRPFEGETASDLIAAVLMTEPPPLVRSVPDVPRELEHVVGKALCKDRELRYQYVKDLLIDLDDLKQELELAARLEHSPIPRRHAGAVTIREESDLRKVSSAGYSMGETARRRTGLALALAALAAVGYFALLPAGPRPIRSLAVLPLANGSESQDLDYLSEGISESLINSLSQLPDVKVIAKSSSFKYRGQVAPQEVARALGVEAVLTGRVAQRADRLLISVELVDARDNTHVWGEQYNRKAEVLLATQAEISREIAERLRVRLTAGERLRLAKHDTDSAEAYRLYLKGRYFWSKRTQEGVQDAIVYFRRAIEQDTDYALAYAGLADSYSALGVPDALLGSLPPRESFPAAREAALQALEIDPELAEAHTSLAHVFWHYDWDWAAAEREFKRSIELKPNYVLAHYRYGLFLTFMGRTEEAVVEMRRALELDPVSLATNANLGYVLYWAGRYDEAIEQCRRTLEMDPDFALAHHRLGLAYEQKGMYEEAIRAFQAAAHEDNQIAVAALGHAYAVSGRRAKAQEALERLQELSTRRFVSPYHVAAIYAGLGEKDLAFGWLERAYQARSSDLLKLAGDPQFDRFRTDPRFRDLTRRVGLTP